MNPHAYAYVLCTSVWMFGTVSTAVDPVVAEINTQEGKPPSPRRVPGQLKDAIMVPHINVSSQLTASHHQPEGMDSHNSFLNLIVC